MGPQPSFFFIRLLSSFFFTGRHRSTSAILKRTWQHHKREKNEKAKKTQQTVQRGVQIESQKTVQGQQGVAKRSEEAEKQAQGKALESAISREARTHSQRNPLARAQTVKFYFKFPPQLQHDSYGDGIRY